MLQIKDHPLADLMEAIIEDYQYSYARAIALGNDDCKACNSKSIKPPCPSCQATGYCDDHLVKHMVRIHQDELISQEYQEAFIRKQMLDHNMSAYSTPNREITVASSHKNQFKSAFFDLVEHFGQSRAAIVSWDFPRPTGDSKQSKEQQRTTMGKTLDRDVKHFLDIMDLQAQLWSASDSYTFFVTQTGNHRYLPSDITTGQQDGSLGLLFTPGADPGKYAKRLRVFTKSEGAFALPTPSHFPYFNIPGGRTHRLVCRETAGAGDGSGMYRESAAKELIRASGASHKGDIIAIQLVALGTDYAFKGVYIITPDEQFPEKDADIIVDKDSFNAQVLSRDFTIAKIIPLRHKPNRRYNWVEPLMHGRTVAGFIDPKHLSEQCIAISQMVADEAWNKAMAPDTSFLDIQQEVPQTIEPNHVNRALSNRASATDVARLAYDASGKSPFASPQVMDLLAGGAYKRWKARQRKSDPMPGIMTWGERLLFMHPEYAGVSTPKQGYIRLVWHPRQPSQLIGFCMNPKDKAKFHHATDTADMDDHFEFYPMTDDVAQWALILRLPSSIGGGLVLRINQADAKKLKSIGYHFNQLTGAPRYPGIYDIHEGQPVIPYALKAKPFEQKPDWTTDESKALTSMLAMTRYREVIGRVTDLSANMDRAGIFEPSLHKFNLSEDVIDPSTNGSSDPTTIIEPLQKALIAAIEAGTPMDPCVFDRIKPQLADYLNRTRGKGAVLEPATHCDPQDEIIKSGMQKALQHQANLLNRWMLLANGPKHWLTANYDPQLVDIVLSAYKKRWEAWSHQGKERAKLRTEEDLTNSQKSARTAQLIEQAKLAESLAIADAYLQAIALPNYEDGHFLGLWQKLRNTGTQRFKDTFRPQSTYFLTVLPPQEHLGYYAAGATTPTAIIAAQKIVPKDIMGEKVTIRNTTLGTKAQRCELVTSNGQAIPLNRKMAPYAGLSYKVIAPIPAPQTKAWEQPKHLYLLEADL